MVRSLGTGILDTYGVSVNGVQRQLRRLEVAGILVSRTVGRSRVFEFNTRIPSVRNLRVFLASELDLLPESDVRAYYRQRQRPRRMGKR